MDVRAIGQYTMLAYNRSGQSLVVVFDGLVQKTCIEQPDRCKEAL